MVGQINRMPLQTRNGKWKEVNKRAVLIAEGHYVNNKKHGVWREYYDSNGGLMIEENYWDGVQHERVASYHPNGQLMSEGQFQYGMREGCFKVYDENGTNIRNIIFVADQEIEASDGYKARVGSTTTGRH